MVADTGCLMEDFDQMRCAIYTRKSGDEAADVQFSTLEAQRELCEKYIESQAGAGWMALSQHFDDGGYSGGNLNRPALKALRKQIDQRLVDIVVVYKIDRLSRSLLDFSNLVSQFEARGVTFVSITQSFNTSTSMGRLILNTLLSFAQFERELTGERLRDWFAGARKRGLWMSGKPPFGYDRTPDGFLLINPTEAKVVRRIYALYPRILSVEILTRSLTAEGHVSNRGRPLTWAIVKRVLHNRLYLGEMPHGDGYVPGLHEAIVDERTWRRAQRAMKDASANNLARRRIPVEAMLKGLLFGPDGYQMVHYFAYGKNGQIYRYYLCRPQRNTNDLCLVGRLRAGEIEAAVIKLVCGLIGTSAEISPEVTGMVRRLVHRIDVDLERMTISLTTGAKLDTEIAGRMASTSRRLAIADIWRKNKK